MFWFRKAEDLALIIDALGQAGLPEWPFGFTADPKDQLTGAEISALGCRARRHYLAFHPWRAGCFHLNPQRLGLREKNRTGRRRQRFTGWFQATSPRCVSQRFLFRWLVVEVPPTPRAVPACRRTRVWSSSTP